MSRATRRRRALVLVAVGASQVWTASLLGLPALEHHLVGFGVLANVDRQAESKISSHAHVFDSMWAFQPVRFERVFRYCQPSLPLLSPSLPLSLSLSLSLSLFLSLSLPLSASLHIVMHTDNGRNLKPCWKTRCDSTGSSFFRMQSVYMYQWLALSLRHVTSSPSAVPRSSLCSIIHLLLLHIHTVSSA